MNGSTRPGPVILVAEDHLDSRDALKTLLEAVGYDVVVATDGATLRGHRCGDPSGQTVLLVHGYVESVRFWAPVVRRLVESGLDVVVVDQRGHGDSDRGDAPFSTDTLAADVRAWLTA